MIAADSDGEASSRETTRSNSQENHHHDDKNQQDDALNADSEDLKLWLQHTGYFDVEHRRKVLGALHKLQAIDEQRSMILSEIRSSNECHPGFLSASRVPQSPMTAASGSFFAQRTGCDVDYGFDSRRTTLASPGERCGSEISSSENKGADSENWSMTFGNRSSSSQQLVQNAQPSIEATTTTPDVLYYESQEAESPPSLDRSSEPESRHAGKGRGMRSCTTTQILTLAPKQESRYFLIKSFSATNVDMSQQDGLWITSETNGIRFANAFHQHKNVFLIFSINKSKAFQGYARMTTLPTANISPAKWMSSISWEPSAPFRIQWLNTRCTEFWKLGHLKNSFNDNEPVFVGRDGQEFPEACGRKMLRVMDREGGSRERTGATISWTTRKRYYHVDKVEMANWQQDESSEAGEVVSASTEPEPVDDMPLIEY